jgi:EAL domain-containing protein (putative c-di-GMP-specific phosphodiesterase class I)
LSPNRLTLEVTESTLMENVASGREVLAAIREIGVRIALDDFGTGYSSLSHLQASRSFQQDRSIFRRRDGNEFPNPGHRRADRGDRQTP